MNVFEKFLKLMEEKIDRHRKVAQEFRMTNVGDSKYHDGLADMASTLKLEYELMFTKELKPCDLIQNIDNPV